MTREEFLMGLASGPQRSDAARFAIEVFDAQCAEIESLRRTTQAWDVVHAAFVSVAPDRHAGIALGDAEDIVAQGLRGYMKQRAEIESLRKELDQARNGIGARVMRSLANDAPSLMQELGVARDAQAESRAEVEWLRTLCGVAAPYIADAIPLHREAGYTTGNLQALFDLLIAARDGR